MSEEIKEILYLQNYIDKYKSDEKAIIKGNRLTTPAMLDYLEVKALLNYITSLQQKVEQLEKENKILKDTILKALEFINNHTYRWKDTQFGEMVEVEDFEPGLKPIELINILQNIFENK